MFGALILTIGVVCLVCVDVSLSQRAIVSNYDQNQVYVAIGKNLTLEYKVEPSDGGTISSIEINVVIPSTLEKVKIASISLDVNGDVKGKWLTDDQQRGYKGRVDVEFDNKNKPNLRVTIRDIVSADIGLVFECSASVAEDEDFGGGKDEIKVLKAELPIFNNTDIFRLHYIKRGEQETIICRGKGTPSPHIYWMHEDEVKINGEATLIISNANESTDAGKYHCVAENVAGRVQKTVEIIIIFIELDPENTKFISKSVAEDSVHVSCPVNGEPKLTEENFYWTHNNTKGVSSILNTNKKELRLGTLQESDIGLYSCTGKNMAGSLTHRVLEITPASTSKPRTDKTKTVGDTGKYSSNVTVLSSLLFLVVNLLAAIALSNNVD